MSTHNDDAVQNNRINSETELSRRSMNITMEIPIFLLFLGLSLSGTVMNNILLYRTCVHVLHYNETVCANFEESDHTSHGELPIEADIQKQAALVIMVKSVLEGFCPALLSLFLGVWSDSYGRKPLVVWPLLGISVSTFLVIIFSVLNNLGPWWFILTAIPFSLMGGFSAFFTGAFCYISDITSTESRSFRLSLLEAALYMGTIFGYIISPYIVNAIGNVFTLVLTAVFYVMAYAYTNIWIEESISGALKGSLLSVMDMLLVKEMLHTCFKRRQFKQRYIILSLVMVNSLTIFVLYGLVNIDYLYAREKLGWDLKAYSIYNAANTLILVVGLIIGVTFIQKVLRVSDLFLAMISLLSCIADYVIKTFAYKSWHMYLAGSVSLFRGVSSPLIRSFFSKILPVTDMAKVFALMSALEAIFPIFAPVMYNTLYSSTVAFCPGVVYMMTAGIFTVCVILLGTVQYYLWKYTISSYTMLRS